MFLVFLILKLTDHIDWSWWWVTAPLWIPLGIAAVVAGIALSVMAIVGQLDKRKYGRRY